MVLSAFCAGVITYSLFTEWSYMSNGTKISLPVMLFICVLSNFIVIKLISLDREDKSLKSHLNDASEVKYELHLNHALNWWNNYTLSIRIRLSRKYYPEITSIESLTNNMIIHIYEQETKSIEK